MSFIRFRSALITLALLAAATIQMPAQMMPRRTHSSNWPMDQTASTLSGRLETGGPADFSRLRIVVLPLGGRDPIAETAPNVHGTFDLNVAATGVMELRVLSLTGDMIHAESITLPTTITHRINLNQGNATAGKLSSVSLARMLHKVPKDAEKAFNAAARASTKGDRHGAVEHLGRAIEHDPLYFEAINNLGVQLVFLNRMEDAAAAFERAAAIDPADSLTESNLAFVLLRLGKFPEAEQAARASVRADGLSGRARFYLAVSLLEQNKPRKEAIFHLSQAGAKFEPARELLEKLTNEAKLSRVD